MTKRDSPDACCRGDAKKAKTEQLSVEEETIQMLAPFTKELNTIEKECMTEQMRIQREFEKKKRPILEKRDAEIEKAPGLWAKIICSCQNIRDFLSPPEAELLLKYLSKVTLEDHLDDNGSYEVTFSFKPSVAEIFTPTELKKSVVFTDEDQEDLEKCQVTEISFKDAEKDPRVLIQKMETTTEADDETMSEMPQGSILGWFSEKNVEHPVFNQFGELFRRLIYADPAECLADSESDSEEDDDEE